MTDASLITKTRRADNHIINTISINISCGTHTPTGFIILRLTNEPKTKQSIFIKIAQIYLFPATGFPIHHITGASLTIKIRRTNNQVIYTISVNITCTTHTPAAVIIAIGANDFKTKVSTIVKITQIYIFPTTCFPIHHITDTSITIRKRRTNNQVIYTISVNIACSTDTIAAPSTLLGTNNPKTSIYASVHIISIP